MSVLSMCVAECVEENAALSGLVGLVGFFMAAGMYCISFASHFSCHWRDGREKGQTF